MAQKVDQISQKLQQVDQEREMWLQQLTLAETKLQEINQDDQKEAYHKTLLQEEVKELTLKLREEESRNDELAESSLLNEGTLFEENLATVNDLKS